MSVPVLILGRPNPVFVIHGMTDGQRDSALQTDLGVRKICKT